MKHLQSLGRLIESQDGRRGRPQRRLPVVRIGAGLLLTLAAACNPPGIETAPQPETALRTPATAEKSQPEKRIAAAVRPPLGKNVPGSFDFYVLSLSWSPQHCATRRSPRPDDPQCGNGRAFSFIVHGLWPQYLTGFPEACAAPQAVAPELVERLLRIMPSPRLIQHEWDKHGTCSGLAAEPYFAQTESLWASVQLPPRYRSPAEPLRTTVAALRTEFLSANPALPQDGSSLAVVCQGEYLQELRLCYGKDLRPRACSSTVSDSCPAAGITVRPVAQRTE